jgi:hypothetical protein
MASCETVKSHLWNCWHRKQAMRLYLWLILGCWEDSGMASLCSGWLPLRGGLWGWGGAESYLHVLWACTIRGFTPQLFISLSCMVGSTTSVFFWQSAQWMLKPLIRGECVWSQAETRAAHHLACSSELVVTDVSHSPRCTLKNWPCGYLLSFWFPGIFGFIKKKKTF